MIHLQIPAGETKYDKQDLLKNPISGIEKYGGELWYHGCKVWELKDGELPKIQFFVILLG